MSVAAQVSIDEYLHTSYDPDCDYVEGVLIERNVGQTEHSRLQILLGAYLVSHEKEWKIFPVTEQRVQVAPGRIRIPDICLLLGGHPGQEVFQIPPFVCIEILSPDDSMSGMQDRIDDYLAFGVKYVWIVDPWRLRAYVTTDAGMSECRDGVLRTSDPEIVVPIAELFSHLR
jgi:Uma2 family endonuclease